MSATLFGHLAFRFTSSPENLATEALGYILNQSLAAREAFADLFSHLHIPLSSHLKFETQKRSDPETGIPDLVGRDAEGKAVLLGEAKFWAGLTASQPTAYLQRLAHAGGTALVFFAPAQRFATLWPELQRRCQAAGIALEKRPSENPEIQIEAVEAGQFLVLMSWRVLLAAIHHSLVMKGDLEMAGNVVQLQGLCEQMDSTAFLPLRSEELTGSTGRRVLQMCDIVDNVAEVLAAKGWAVTKGLRASASRNGYIRYMRTHQHGVQLEFNALLWNKYGATPIWLGIQTQEWAYDAEAREKLVQLEVKQPPILFQEDKVLYVPIFLETGVEKPDLVRQAVEQIRQVLVLLPGETTP